MKTWFNEEQYESVMFFKSNSTTPHNHLSFPTRRHHHHLQAGDKLCGGQPGAAAVLPGALPWLLRVAVPELSAAFPSAESRISARLLYAAIDFLKIRRSGIAFEVYAALSYLDKISK